MQPSAALAVGAFPLRNPTDDVPAQISTLDWGDSMKVTGGNGDGIDRRRK